MNTKQCYFCTNNVKDIDYKNIELLKRFVDQHSRIGKRRRSSVCSKHQRKLALAIKHARYLALMPYISS